jgi:DNA-binding transcriptional LysR family regulator
LSAAARELRTTQPTVSKLLAQLERQLAVRLLERSTRGLSPTEQGQRFYRDVKLVIEQFDSAVGSVQGMAGQTSGFLRINAPVALGQFWVNGMLQQFLADNSGIEAELILTDRFVDLVEDGVDVAFRLGGVLPNDAVGRHLARIPRFLVASPEYLRKHGIPHAPEDLPSHSFVRFAWASGGFLELFSGTEQRRLLAPSRFRVNNALAIREALLLGSGIGVCPGWLINDLLDRGELVRVLPDWESTHQDLYLLYPSRLYQPMRTRLFIDFASEQFARLPGFECDRR